MSAILGYDLICWHCPYYYRKEIGTVPIGILDLALKEKVPKSTLKVLCPSALLPCRLKGQCGGARRGESWSAKIFMQCPTVFETISRQRFHWPQWSSNQAFASTGPVTRAEVEKSPSCWRYRLPPHPHSKPQLLAKQNVPAYNYLLKKKSHARH